MRAKNEDLAQGKYYGSWAESNLKVRSSSKRLNVTGDISTLSRQRVYRASRSEIIKIVEITAPNKTIPAAIHKPKL